MTATAIMCSSAWLRHTGSASN